MLSYSKIYKTTSAFTKDTVFLLFLNLQNNILLVRLSIFLGPKASPLPNMVGSSQEEKLSKLQVQFLHICANICQITHAVRMDFGKHSAMVFIYAYTVQQIFAYILQGSCCILCRKVKYGSSHSRPFCYSKMLG